MHRTHRTQTDLVFLCVTLAEIRRVGKTNSVDNRRSIDLLKTGTRTDVINSRRCWRSTGQTDGRTDGHPIVTQIVLRLLCDSVDN